MKKTLFFLLVPVFLSGCSLLGSDDTKKVDDVTDITTWTDIDAFLKGSETSTISEDGFSQTYTIDSVPYMLSGSVPEGTQKIKIVWNNNDANQSDRYWLKKYEKGDTEWVSNLHVRLKNIAKGQNEYELIFYLPDNKEWKRKIKVIYE